MLPASILYASPQPLSLHQHRTQRVTPNRPALQGYCQALFLHPLFDSSTNRRPSRYSSVCRRHRSRTTQPPACIASATASTGFSSVAKTTSVSLATRHTRNCCRAVASLEHSRRSALFRASQFPSLRQITPSFATSTAHPRRRKRCNHPPSAICSTVPTRPTDRKHTHRRILCASPRR